MIKFKKSQAALEFLTTYAWALILIAIVVGAIAYFGILRPQQVLPDRCTFNVAFGCDEVLVSDTNDEIILKLKNQVGEPVTIGDFTFEEEDGTPITCTDPAYPSPWPVGGFVTLTWTLCTLPADYLAGEKAKMLIELVYNTGDPTFSRIAEGEVLTTVQ